MIKVLMFYDVEGWAWWHRCRNVQRHIQGWVQVDVRKIGQPFDPELYDFVVIFESIFWSEVAHAPAHKIIVGCSCPKLIERDLFPLLSDRQPAAVLVNNATMARTVASTYRCFCCPNGVDADLFFPAKKWPEQECAAWVGSTHSFVDKGLSLIQGVCAKANLPLMIVDQANVIGRGRLYSQEELRERVYHQATVYFCASEAEGTPNPCLEALACGVPVISTSVGNMPEIIVNGKNGMLVQHRTSEDIFDAIQHLRQQDPHDLSASARESILSDWTWQHRARSYAKMFKQLRNRLKPS